MMVEMLEDLMEDGLVPDWVLIIWQVPDEEEHPTQYTTEIITFVPFFERGAVLLLHPFFCRLLH